MAFILHRLSRKYLYCRRLKKKIGHTQGWKVLCLQYLISEVF